MHNSIVTSSLLEKGEVNENDQEIIKESLNNEDYNLVRLMIEGFLFDCKTELDHSLLFGYDYVKVIEKYRALLQLDHVITELYEGI